MIEPPGLPAVAAGALHVVVVRVGNLDRQEEIAARVAAREAVAALGRAEVAGAFLGSTGIQPERDSIGAQHVVTAHQVQSALGLAHQYAIRNRQLDAQRSHRAGMIRKRVARRGACEQAREQHTSRRDHFGG